jgi:hypothetical protein
MKPNKLKLDPNGPWEPTCWVGDGPAVPLAKLDDGSRRKYAGMKAIAAIMRAKRVPFSADGGVET